MAVVLKSVVGSVKQSIARVELMTDAHLVPDNWTLNVHFEDGTYDASNTLMGPTEFGSRRITRKFGDIKNKTVTIPDAAGTGTITVTIAQLATFIQVASYAMRTEDIAAETAAANTPGPGTTTP